MKSDIQAFSFAAQLKIHLKFSGLRVVIRRCIIGPGDPVKRGQYYSIDLGLVGERKQLGPWILMTIRRKDKEKSLFPAELFLPGCFYYALLRRQQSQAVGLGLGLPTTIVLCALLDVFHASLLKGNLGQGFSLSFFFFFSYLKILFQWCSMKNILCAPVF